MPRLYTIAIALFVFTLKLSAQFDTDYKPVTSRGTLPADFVTLSAKKYEEAKSKISTTENESKRKVEEGFLLESNFGTDDILLSGKVLFNDDLTNYLNSVADKALAGEPALRKQLRFYVYKSTSVNAFSTGAGVVLVTTGLLAQLENEAQLAFVICHESIHYREKHAINEYIQQDKIEKEQGVYAQLAFEEKVVARCAFSREEEKEADQKGLAIFLESQYSTQHMIGLYDVLKYSYLPFDDIVFDKSFFENQYLKFPARFYKTKTLEIETKDILDTDPRSTHPSVALRKEKTQDRIKGADNTGKADYLIGEKEFINAREISRFELSRLYTLHKEYEEGIYHSYLLLKKYPNNIYLKKNIGFCLAGLAQYSNHNRFKEVHDNSDSVEGKSQALSYLMYKLDGMGYGTLNVVALSYAVKLKTEYPNDEDIEGLYKNLLCTLIKSDNFKFSDFLEWKENKQDGTDAKTTDTTKSDTGRSKYEKLREQEASSFKQPSGNPIFIKYAFSEYLNNGWFKKDFLDAEDSINTLVLKGHPDKIIVQHSNYYSDDYMAERARIDYLANHVYALGLDRIVVVDPEYVFINTYKTDGSYRYLESEAGQVDFTERIKQNAKEAKVDVNILNSKNLQANEAEKLNDLSIMADYISERHSHEKDVLVPYVERSRLKALAAKYGTDYFMWTGAAYIRSDRVFTVFYVDVYDIKNDEIKMRVYREIRKPVSANILNTNISDVLTQVKTKPAPVIEEH